MILKKLYIHNYKSFYDTTIELGKFNIIIGENNSGKSNIIDVLEFIDIAMKKDIERAIDDKGGYDNIKNYRTDEEKIIIRATFENTIKRTFGGNNGLEKNSVAQGRGVYTLSFSFTKKAMFFSLYIDMKFRLTKTYKTHEEIDDEFMKKLKNHSVKMIISNMFFVKSSHEKQRICYFHKIEQDFIKEHLKEILSYINISNNKKLTLDLNYIKHISTYYFNTDIIKSKSHEDGIDKLKKDGSNLGKNIYQLKDDSEFEIISNSLITTVNELDGIKIHKVADNYILIFLEGDKEIGINKVSDGTVNLLATITALNQPVNNNFLLVFEEPERHLHLKAVNYLLDEFRNYKAVNFFSQQQILITTHSTEILKDANLEEIIFIYRDIDGDTQAIKATNIPDLEGKMKRLGYDRPLNLDDLIADNIIGDFA